MSSTGPLRNLTALWLDQHFTAKWTALGPAWTRANHRRAWQRWQSPETVETPIDVIL